METYISRQQVRSMNKKLIAYDFLYTDNDAKETVKFILSRLFNSTDILSKTDDTPIILRMVDDEVEYISECVRLVDSDKVFIQVNYSSLINDCVLSTVKKLKEDGYTIIVNIDTNNKDIILCNIADIIKCNINYAQEYNFKDLLCNNVKLLVSDVTNEIELKKAEEINANYYEGTYLYSINDIERTDEDNQRTMNALNILGMINSENPDLVEISEVINKDAILASQLIKLSNSIYFTGRNKITDIRKATIRLGISNIRRWIMLINIGSTRQIEEILKISYLRAVMAEGIISRGHNKDISKEQAYLVGLLSTLDIIIGKPMEYAIASMGLNEIVTDALVYREGTGGKILNLLKAYEEAKWDKVYKYVKEFKIDKKTMYKLYFESIEEVTKTWCMLEQLRG